MRLPHFDLDREIYNLDEYPKLTNDIKQRGILEASKYRQDSNKEAEDDSHAKDSTSGSSAEAIIEKAKP